MRFIYLLLFALMFSCNTEKVIQLPEIENADITEVLDVSPAYIFYDETQPDSTLLNRKNLISTTNWLVNVDKRLTLKQAIPHIQYLQNKRKKASMHKNENAKNYFTCNDTSIKNLGFLEFTGVNYYNNKNSYNSDKPLDKSIRTVYIHFFSNGYFNVSEFFDNKQVKSEISLIESDFHEHYFSYYRKNKNTIYLSFDKRMNFQNYITTKSRVLKFTNKMSEISNDEFIY